MESDQWKPGQVVVKPDIVSPCPFVVTLVATFPFLSLVHIIRFMAPATEGGQFDFLLHRLGMAKVALQFFMRSLQGEIRLNFVIKFPGPPALGVMAQSALVAQTLLVDIFLLVAVHAVIRSLFVAGGQVAVFASRYRVQADERKPGPVVIEFDLVSPGVLVVAAVAFLTFLSLVNVVLLVTRIALRAEFLLVGVPLVTTQTVDFGVAVNQFEFRVFVVIEDHFLPLCGSMAFVALAAELTFMRVIRLVTGGTLRFQLSLVKIIRMAGSALHFRVASL